MGTLVLHTGQTPNGAGGGFSTLAIAGAVHAVGMPIVRGGSARFVEALVKLIEDHGGKVVTDAAVKSIVVRNGRAVGVRSDAGELRATRAVIANARRLSCTAS